MQLHYIKLTIAGVWVLLAVVIGVAAGVTSVGARVLLVALGLLPPLGLMLLWHDPSPTMSESIDQGRRR